jgi:hypothetical protein
LRCENEKQWGISKLKHTPDEIRAMIKEIEDTHQDVIRMSAREIATHENVVYWHSRRTRFIGMVDILKWVLGEETDHSKYPCMDGWAEALAKAGISPWAESQDTKE